METEQHLEPPAENVEEPRMKRAFLKKGTRWAAVTSKISAPGTVLPKRSPNTKAEQNNTNSDSSQNTKDGYSRPNTATTPSNSTRSSSQPGSNRRATTPLTRAARDINPEPHTKSQLNPNNKRASSLPYMEYIGKEERYETDQFLQLENKVKNNYAEAVVTKQSFLSDPLFDDDQQSESHSEDEYENNGGFISQYISPLDKLPDPFHDTHSEQEDDETAISSTRSKHMYDNSSQRSPQFYPKTPNEMLKESPSTMIDIDPPFNSYRSMYEKRKSIQKPIEEDEEDNEELEDRQDSEEELENNRPQRLVRKYFHSKPSDKIRKKKEVIQQRKLEKEEEKQRQRAAQELEEHLNHFRAKERRVQEMTEELLTERQKLNLEKQEFIQFKEREKEKFELFKESEMKKINKEKRVFERQAKASQHFLSRREQEKEIEKLKQKINDMNQDFKAKERNYKSTIDNLKKKNEQLLAENTELQEELKRRELERIDFQFDQKTQTTSPVVASNRYSQEVENSYDSSDMGHEDMVESEWEHENFCDKNQYSLDTQQPVNKCKDTPISSYVQSLREKYLYEYEDDIETNLFEEDDDELDRVVSSTKLDGGQTAKKYLSGKVEVIHRNGSIKKSLPGQYSILYFGNGDIKKTYPDNRIVYFYASANTTHTSLPNGLEIFKFSNLQVERHYPDGTKEIIFPDETIKYIRPSGEEEIWFSDGTVQLTTVGRDRIITFPDGHKESKFRDGTVRIEYSDGTVKTLRE